MHIDWSSPLLTVLPAWGAVVVAVIAFVKSVFTDRAQKRLAATMELGVGRSSRRVDWTLESPESGTFVLRNIGRRTAKGVRVIAPHPGKSADLPDGQDVPSLRSVRFLLLPTWEHPHLDELEVTWGLRKSQVVPVHRRS